jgi:asparagine synthase (glutamine-hydrolysing)
VQQNASAAKRLVAMTAALQHRGPDAQRGVLLDGAALGHTRLSIVDVSGGHQPMRDPNTGVCLVFNGEIFNYVELRRELRAYQFRTNSDTEVIIAAYDRWGMSCVEHFFGQWAFALWDPRRRELRFSRDRVGVVPLYYTETREEVAFASEAKAIFAGGFVTPSLDPFAVKETTCLWSPVVPRTSFANVLTLPPGCNGLVVDGRVRVQRYWSLELADECVDPSLSLERAVPAVAELLDDAVRLRLRADVPVAAYLSGGLDSTLLCALAQRRLRGANSRLSTFSVSFSQARYDESRFQRQVASELATEHHEMLVDDACVGRSLPEVVRLAEQLLVRSAPAPLLALSGLVRSQGTKVVLTGEGADEFFWGYQLYQETKIRSFWARMPKSKWRYLLLHKLYPYLRLSEQSPALLKQFYGIGLDEPDQPAFSHLLRWSSSRRIWRFFSPRFDECVRTHDPVQTLLQTVPADFARWRSLARAQYLEMNTLLSGYLLSAQGDRMLMGNSVEGRFPFLDHRLVELAARLPDAVKLHVLDGKHVCKQIATPLVPRAVLERSKYPYRAPIAETLVGAAAPEWTREALSPDAINAVGVFDGRKAKSLCEKLARPGSTPSESDNMALMAIASVQLLDRQLVRAASPGTAARAAVRLMTADQCDTGVSDRL